MTPRAYIAIDLKSFYASVECMERGLDPLTTNLVVADERRTSKTIVLAVSPSLKAYGIPGRPRLFEVEQKLREVNALRRQSTRTGKLVGSSIHTKELAADPALAVDVLVVPPQMAHYIAVSTKIYDIYLQYIAPEDIHVYSIDEVFIDATHYLHTYGLSAHDLAMKIILDVLAQTGITATAGIGTNLYLAKIAMDIDAKHIPPDENGVRIAMLDELSYRKRLWAHRPLTDFWRIGKGSEKKLADVGIYTMGDICRCSLGAPDDYYNEELLYKLFGVQAELLIDHAWGWEPTTIADIKAYKPERASINAGQVLSVPYNYAKARLIVKEMVDSLVLDLVDKGLVTNQIVMTIGYDSSNLKNSRIADYIKDTAKTDRYGRKIPKHAHGTENLEDYTSSTKKILAGALRLYDRIVDEDLLVRRLGVTAAGLITESQAREKNRHAQQSLFADTAALAEEACQDEKEKRVQESVLALKKRFGKNAVLKAMNLEEGATAKDRNEQIGGHKA